MKRVLIAAAVALFIGSPALALDLEFRSDFVINPETGKFEPRSQFILENCIRVCGARLVIPIQFWNVWKMGKPKDANSLVYDWRFFGRPERYGYRNFRP